MITGVTEDALPNRASTAPENVTPADVAGDVAVNVVGDVVRDVAGDAIPGVEGEVAADTAVVAVADVDVDMPVVDEVLPASMRR